MKRIAVVASTPLFVEGGHLVMARALVQALRETGHESELVLTPQNRFGRQGAAYLAAWLTDVGMGHNNRPVDQVISLRYPSYAVRHPNHVVWLNHTMREYYDQWEAFSAPLSWKGRIKEGTRRRLIHSADRWLLTRNVRKVFTISRTVKARLERWGGITSEPLHPPPPQRAYRCEAYGDYIFAISRLAPLKRLSLLVEALANPEAAGIRCVIAGEGEELAVLEHAVVTRGLASRVKLIGRIDERQLLEHLAQCRAVCFPPFDEDYGFVTVEAFASRKPVVTCTDSGGPAELVVDAVNGKVCAPRPETLAVALREVMEDARLAERLGTAGLDQVSQMTWPRAIKHLLAPA
ncbi:MAG: glycosyltransferase [Acidobacteria bacterium]|nr:glycosyltransferase [Acidobacteriota bacterium]